MRHWTHRFVLIYFGINALAALTFFPWTARIGSGLDLAEQFLLEMVVGRSLDVGPTGSGDTLLSYLSVSLHAAVSLVAATAWHLRRGGVPVSVRTHDVATILVRFALGIIMLSYGVMKVIPVQMSAPGPGRLVNTLAETSPMGLLWTLMGLSPAYQIFAGAGETIGGVLLFWRRTTLIGALILVAVLANVVALNFCYDVPVKVFSSHLLAMAGFLVAPHLTRLANVLWLNRPALPIDLRPFPYRRAWTRRAAPILKAAVVLSAIGVPAASACDIATQYGFLRRATAIDGVYRVASFSRAGAAGTAITDAQRWITVAIEGGVGLAVVRRADGSKARLRLELDEAQRRITFRDVRNPAMPMTYTMSGPDGLRLQGAFEGGDIVAELAREPATALVLTGRGFHWISAYPFNR